MTITHATKRRRVSVLLPPVPVTNYPVALDTDKTLEYTWAKSVIHLAASSKNSVVLSRATMYKHLVAGTPMSGEARLIMSLGSLQLGVDFVYIVEDNDKIRFARNAIIRFLVYLGGESSRLGNRWYEAQQKRLVLEHKLQGITSHVTSKGNVDLMVSAINALHTLMAASNKPGNTVNHQKHERLYRK